MSGGKEAAVQGWGFAAHTPDLGPANPLFEASASSSEDNCSEDQRTQSLVGLGAEPEVGALLEEHLPLGCVFLVLRTPASFCQPGASTQGGGGTLGAQLVLLRAAGCRGLLPLHRLPEPQTLTQVEFTTLQTPQIVSLSSWALFKGGNLPPQLLPPSIGAGM